jgi:transitional endoplasmic reticulum ATPase
MTDASPRLPLWAQELRNRYLAGEGSMFLVHGNVRDLHVWEPVDGAAEWLSLRAFLERFLGRTRDVVAYYNVSQGIRFSDRAQEKRFRVGLDARRALRGSTPLGALPEAPAAVLELLEELVTDPSQSSAAIIDYCETVVPAGDLSFMGFEDKANLVAAQRWASDPAFLATDNLVVLVTEHLSDVSRRVVASPQLQAIAVPYPTLEDRLRFLEHEDRSGVRLEMPLETLARIAAGLSLVQIRALLRGARQTGHAITFAEVSRRKKSIIEQECHGLVEFVAPTHGFDEVGGMDGVKAELRRVADAVRQGQRSRVPMGMIFLGAMGTGKTYVAEAFAAECGLTCLKFKNFRDRWVGSTESNLEKVLGLVEALGYVLLIIDEADRSLASGDSDGGTNSRVIARLKEFMSDTRHRGRVVALMMTNRPDKLDTDLKRPGRFDLKIPFFFAESPEERESILRASAKKNGVSLDPAAALGPVAVATEGYSSAELEAVLLAAASRAVDAGREQITLEDLDSAVRDVVPSRDTRMLEYMELLAVFEASSRRMLPARYRDLSTDDVHARLDAVRERLGRRAAI